MPKPILVSGIQSSGRSHIGNYLGMLKHAVELQNGGKYSCYYFIADLHSLTEYPKDAREQQHRVLEITADALAAGLDPKKSVFFQQSQVPAHSELAWILSTIASEGDLRRMTQYKDKASRGEDANAGLLFYPTLMAADILLYGANFVPVGNDQDQHLELTRTLARKFNKKFGKTFVEPQALHTATPRVMSLKDPAKKMSKSEPETCLFLDESPEEIKAKIMSAVTDSGSEVKYEPDKKPGLANLIGIYAGVSGIEIPTLEKKFAGKGYGEFKKSLAAEIANHLALFRKKKMALIKKPGLLKQVLRRGSVQAAKVANKKIVAVKKVVGLDF